MTNAPKTRKTHVIRILGTNKNGDVLSDIWADVERIDEAKSVFQHAEVNWQGSVRRLKWLDDPDADNFNPDGPPSRKTRIVKVCSPDEPNQDDPEQWIPIPVIDKMRSAISDQNSVRSFVNVDGNRARVVEKRRILHYDTSIDADAQAAFAADPTRKVFVVSGDRYSRLDDTKDDSQWIEHEIVTFLKNRTTGQTKVGSGDDQSKQTKLLNKYLIDESEPATLEIVGSNGFNPPWRLDPYQNIVNIQFGGDNFFVLIGLAGTAFTSSDGFTWSDISGTVKGMFTNGGSVGSTGSLGFARPNPGLFLIGGSKPVTFDDGEGGTVSQTFANMIGSFDGTSWFGVTVPNSKPDPSRSTSISGGISWGSHSKLVSTFESDTSAAHSVGIISSDGISWLLGEDNDILNVPNEDGIRPVKLGGVVSYYVTGNGVSIREKSGGGLEASSDSGNTWTGVAGFSAPMNVASFGFASGAFVAVGQNLTVSPNITMVQTSRDGFTWETTLKLSSNDDGLSLLATGKVLRN